MARGAGRPPEAPARPRTRGPPTLRPLNPPVPPPERWRGRTLPAEPRPYRRRRQRRGPAGPRHTPGWPAAECIVSEDVPPARSGVPKPGPSSMHPALRRVPADSRSFALSDQRGPHSQEQRFILFRQNRPGVQEHPVLFDAGHYWRISLAQPLHYSFGAAGCFKAG